MTKRPRHYAAEIIALATPDERRAALEQVPGHNKNARRESLRDAEI